MRPPQVAPPGGWRRPPTPPPWWCGKRIPTAPPPPLVFEKPMPVACPPPVLLSVTLCGALEVPTVIVPNARASGDAPRFGVAAAVPVPLRLTVTGVPPAYATVIVSLSAPAAVGAYAT